MSIKTYNLCAKHEKLKKYCPLSKDNDFMEVIEWWNGEGFDVVISRDSKIEERFSITHGELNLLNVLVNYED